MVEKKKGEGKAELLHATVTLRSKTGESIHKGKKGKKRKMRDLRPAPEAFIDARKEFERMGFKIVAQGKFTLTISSRIRHFEKTFGVKVKRKEHPVFAGKKGGPRAKYYELDRKIRIPKEMADLVDQISLPPPYQFLESANAPHPDYHHLHVPEQIACLMRAATCHSHGWTGEGVKVVMVDSGFFDHEYYSEKGYDINVVAVVGNTADDEYGHGTGIASNLLAIAPEIDFTMVKISVGGGLMTLAGFQEAVSLNPDIITCSWGGPFVDPNLEAEIEDAVESGIVVVFACGNGGAVGWPGDMEDVISVGGAMVDDTLQNWEASSYSSSGASPNYAGRNVPDVCGVCGPDPAGVLIVMPTEPNSIFDEDFADGDIATDDTQEDDGWLVASGTSSAAPMVAGVIALMMQKNPNLSPDTAKTILMLTARDIITGVSASGDAAGPGVDDATGHGLVDAEQAVEACFIATAAYGSKLAAEVQFLRSFRNAWVRESDVGKTLMDRIERVYYRYSPKVAMAMRHDPRLKRILRWIIVGPVVKGLRLVVGKSSLEISQQEENERVQCPRRS
jgi:hypothetical protein